jgi:predicted RNase H-like HicB family nuclease
MRYLLVIETADTNFSAFFPDVPGCIATGKTVEETVRLASEALTLHLEGEDSPAGRSVEELLMDSSVDLSQPGTYVTSVELATPVPA